MARKYYVWKDPACGGMNIEWLELSGKEFYAMVKRAENKRRRFIRLANDICEDADIITIEATEQEYAAWKQEQNAHYYLACQEIGYDLLSLDAPAEDTEFDSAYDAIADKRMDTESSAQKALLLERLDQTMHILTDEERYLVWSFYSKRKTTVALAEELGVRQCTISRRITAALQKMKKFF